MKTKNGPEINIAGGAILFSRILSKKRNRLALLKPSFCREATAEISQPRSGWISAIDQLRPERTLETGTFRCPFRTKLSTIPATLWLANILRRSATAQRFLKSETVSQC